MPRNSHDSNYWEPGESHETASPSQPAGGTSPGSTLTLGFWPPELWEKKFLLSHSPWSIVSATPETDTIFLWGIPAPMPWGQIDSETIGKVIWGDPSRCHVLLPSDPAVPLLGIDPTDGFTETLRSISQHLLSSIVEINKTTPSP